MIVIERNHDFTKSTSSAAKLGCYLTASSERKGIAIASAYVVKMPVVGRWG